MKFNLNTYYENKNKYDNENILNEILIIVNNKLFKKILCYDYNTYNNRIYLNFIENENINYELFSNLLKKLCNYIYKVYNINYDLIIFDKTKNYNYYECNIYFDKTYNENLIKEI